MDVPGAILALVLAETAVGGLALLWLAPTWGAVRHGYEILLGATLALMVFGAWAALQGPLDSVVDAGQVVGSADAALWTSRGLAVTAALAGLSVVALLVRLPNVGRVVGIAAVLAGLAAFGALADLRASRGLPGGIVQGYAELALGALFLGAVWDGMILGHWYLVERRLSTRYMEWMSWANVVAIGGALIAVLLSARNPVPCAGTAGRELELCTLTFSPILSIGSFTIVLGIGVLALVATIAAFNVKLAKEGGRSIQAATGMFYLAVILAPAVEFASKVRFF